MNTRTSTFPTFGQSQQPAFSLTKLLSVLFAVELRESLDAKTAGDKSDGAYTWGL